jgi:hypothetical protein
MPNESEGARSRLLWLIVGALVTGVGTVIVSLVTPLFSPAASVTATVGGPVENMPGEEEIRVWLKNESKSVSAKKLQIHLLATLAQPTTHNDASTIITVSDCVEKSVSTYSSTFLRILSSHLDGYFSVLICNHRTQWYYPY